MIPKATRRVAMLAVAALFVAGAVPAPPARAASSAPAFAKLAAGEAAPELEAVTLEGKAWSLRKYRGSRVVLEFGSAFCLPCRRTVALLGTMVGPLRKEGVEILHVNIDGPGRTRMVGDFLQKEAPGLPAVMDPGDLAYRFGAGEIPYLVVISPDGTVARTHVGQPRDEADLRRIIGGR